VNYAYSLGKYDVTASQYAAFLNAVAKTDPYGLYNPGMVTDTKYGCGISQSGSSGSYTYSTTKNGNFPVNYVTWGDAARFSNWLQNGEPTGPEGPSTTETGAYTLSGAITTTALMSVTRNPGATWFIPTLDEWYKAAYYKGGSLNAGYWLYPTRNDIAPSNVLSATGTNNANFYINGYTDPTNFLTAVGAFAASPGPYGTFDQGGDLGQWNDTALGSLYRSVRGGAFTSESSILSSSIGGADGPTDEFFGEGFRVATVPEPSTGMLAVLACGLTWWKRKSFRRIA
jgi:formylglycine-generating enzyme required for sulfatase activity